MEHQEEFVEQVDNNTYKCPECGAPMQYDPESSSLKCDYCNRIINLEKEFSDREIDFYSESNDNLSWQKENQLIRCASCGNENVISKNMRKEEISFSGVKLTAERLKKINKISIILRRSERDKNNKPLHNKSPFL